MNSSVLRESLVELLRGGHAHAAAEKALAGVDPRLRNVRPAEGLHSVWEELEHVRIAQEDILRYALDASWESPEWPSGYWPQEAADLTDATWDESVSRFFADLEDVVRLAQDESVDLTANIP